MQEILVDIIVGTVTSLAIGAVFYFCKPKSNTLSDDDSPYHCVIRPNKAFFAVGFIFVLAFTSIAFLCIMDDAVSDGIILFCFNVLGFPLMLYSRNWKMEISGDYAEVTNTLGRKWKFRFSDIERYRLLFSGKRV